MNILIIKTGAMGDVLRTSFIAQALKDKYRKNEPKVFWVTSENAKPLFNNNPYVDHLLSSEDKEKIRNVDFEMVINLEEDEENCRFASSLGANKALGFLYKDGKVIPSPSTKEWFDMSARGERPRNNILKAKNKKTHRQIIGEIVGVDWEKYEPFLRLDSRQRRFASEFLRRHNLSRNDLVIGINTGAADRWPKALSIKKTAQLIDKIHKTYNARILLFGGPNEIERNRDILRISKSPIISTGCGNDLIEFPALISMCSLFITSDSLGLHIALALKRKTIALIGPTSPAEIGMYGLGEKIVAKSKCVCCYKKECKSMDKIDLNDIIESIGRMIEEKVSLVITAFKEPEQIKRAIEAAINQKTKRKYEIIVSAPDKETLDAARVYAREDKRIKVIQDEGKGKSLALNMLFEEIDTDIIILTDGDVWISNNTVEEICSLFSDREIGCITGRPVPVEKRDSMFGYWANFLFSAAHRMRRRAFEGHGFLECSGYLFAFRKKKIERIPLDVAEDSVIPYYFWEKGYRIGYAERALVYVKNVDNLKDWIKQKVRTSKAHETLEKYVDTETTKRAKTFWNEVKDGIWMIYFYPKSLKEFFWTFELALARLYMWMRVFWDTKIANKNYGDAWERVESTK